MRQGAASGRCGHHMPKNVKAIPDGCVKDLTPDEIKKKS
jgi:hypothetical protein